MSASQQHRHQKNAVQVSHNTRQLELPLFYVRFLRLKDRLFVRINFLYVLRLTLQFRNLLLFDLQLALENLQARTKF